ncbi:MAG: VIT family protein [Lentisphaeria bacterium]|nr:VIT family protein [Lentisphaeria bacterium]
MDTGRIRLPEHHYLSKVNWLRAAVLGANDGIVSTASLIVGVAAATPSRMPILIAGVAGLVAGAMSMAAGEYVSVSSQADSESADIMREKRELRRHPRLELVELTQIYERRGLAPELAAEVAKQLSEHNALKAHLHDELGLSEVLKPHPIQAALSSFAAFTAGALMPLASVLVFPEPFLKYGVALVSLAVLGATGAIAAHTGGARILPATLRVMFWGFLAMAATAGIGSLFGTGA